MEPKYKKLHLNVYKLDTPFKELGILKTTTYGLIPVVHPPPPYRSGAASLDKYVWVSTAEPQEFALRVIWNVRVAYGRDTDLEGIW